MGWKCGAADCWDTANTFGSITVHWLIDAGSIKTGGGVQIALNRLPLLTQALLNAGYHLSILLPSTGPLADIKLAENIQILRSPNNWIKRLFFEYLHLPLWMQENRIVGIYTVFGFGLPHPKSVNSIVSTANATTCYPDSIYWQRLEMATKCKRLIYTYLRQRRLRKANCWIFETEIMRNRSVTYLGLPNAKTHVIGPSPTSFIIDRPAKDYSQASSYKITLLTGNESHKNLDCLAALCKFLMQKNAHNIQFNLTLTKKQLQNAIPIDFDLDEINNINYLGKLPQKQLQGIYDETDIIMNLSELESFSNNYMEAWKAGLAQICSDRDFANHICGKSALYIEPHNANIAAEKIIELLNNKPKLNAMAACGKLQLLDLESQAEYTNKILGLIDAATHHNNHSVLPEIHFPG